MASHNTPHYYDVSVLQSVTTKLLSVKNIQNAQAPGVYKNILCLASMRIYTNTLSIYGHAKLCYFQT